MVARDHDKRVVINAGRPEPVDEEADGAIGVACRGHVVAHTLGVAVGESHLAQPLGQGEGEVARVGDALQEHVPARIPDLAADNFFGDLTQQGDVADLWAIARAHGLVVHEAGLCDQAVIAQRRVDDRLVPHHRLVACQRVGSYRVGTILRAHRLGQRRVRRVRILQAVGSAGDWQQPRIDHELGIDRPSAFRLREDMWRVDRQRVAQQGVEARRQFLPLHRAL